MRFREVLRDLIIFTIFGIIYICIEILWRGYTHFTMFIIGGLCGIIIGHFDEYTPDMPLIVQMVLGSLVITLIEFISGYILNIVLGLNIWDYSNVPMNYLGQICVPFTIIWFFLSYPVILIDNFIRNKIK